MLILELKDNSKEYEIKEIWDKRIMKGRLHYLVK
jgi:hypothetical protein